MSGVLTNQQKSGEYYRIAYKCAETKQTTGCNGNCATCVLNVHLYVDDPREATLIKTSAAMDYVKYVTTKADIAFGNMTWQLGRVFGFLIIASLIFFSYRSCTKPKPTAPTENLPRIEKGSQLDKVTYEAAIMTEWLIPELKEYGDYNYDGLINCIDRACLYYYHIIGNSNLNARLMWIYNTKVNLNHLFVRVNGYDFEPMSIEDDPNKRLMSYYWGSKYSSKYCKDVTLYRDKITEGTMNWTWELY